MSGPDRTGDENHREALALVLGKTRVPLPREGLIRRGALVRRLTDDLDRQVTLVLAPAGYGKSTLLTQWAREDPVRRFGWLSLESADNDPALLWRYIVFALRVAMPGFADKAWELLHEPLPDLEAVVIHALNSLIDIPGRLVLVLDDYHVITNSECHDYVQYFIDHLPKSARLAIGSRIRPPLSLSKMEAGGRVLTIDATALKFTEEETKTVLDRAGRRPSRGDAARVHSRLDGWPVGVYISAVAEGPLPESGGQSGGAAAVRSYLREQMLDQIPEQERTTLAQWSILQHLNGRLCDHVTNREGAASQLEELSEANLLLMPLDSNGEWYRFHDALRDVLRREFAQQPVEQQRTSHLRAMEWWLENDGMPRAIDHALEAGAYQRAAELVCEHWIEYMLNGSLEATRGWIDRIPGDVMLGYPPVLVASAWIAAFTGDAEASYRFSTAAGEASFDGPMPDGSASYESSLEILRAGLGLDGMEDALKHAELAYCLEPQGSPWKPLAAALAGVTRFGVGRFEDARVALTEAARAPIGPDGVATYARGQLALLEMFDGNWEEASRQASIACAVIEDARLQNLLSSGAALAAAAAAAAHFGDHGMARKRLRSLASIQQILSSAIPFDAFQIHLLAAETYLALGDLSAATIHAQSAALRLETFGDGGIFEERMKEVLSVLRVNGKVTAVSGNAPESLTDRELQILTILPSGLSLRDIGEKLYVSRNTTKSHVASVYRKLGVTTRTAAIERARQLDLI